MRKLISLLLAVVMVMGLATVAFAATDAGDHAITIEAEIPATITLAAGETANYSIEGDAAWALMGKEIQLSGDKAGKLWIVPGMYGLELSDLNGYTVSDYVNGHPMMGPMTFAVENTGTEEATYTLTVMAEPGSIGNPLPLDTAWTNYPQTYSGNGYEYYYTYTAGDTPEVLTIHDVALNYNALNMDNLTFNIILTRDDNVEAFLWSEEEGVADEVYMPLAPNQSVVVMVRAAEAEETYTTPSVEFKATAAQVTEISMPGDYQVQDAEAWYAVNSMLAGYIIAVNGDDASVMVDGVVVPAVDGIATAVLNGEGAVILVKVTNGTDMIILPAPTEINAAGDYKATVAAGAEVEYAINSKLAGAVLTVKGEGAYIYMGGTKYEAVNGVASATLDGTGAVIAVKIGNAGTAAGEYELNIAYPPTVITAHGEYKATVGAGAEVEYVVNSKLDGAYVTVKGEGAYLIVDGKKIEGKNGVVSTVLTAKAATIKLVVGNAGTASAEYTVVVSANPPTGDFGIIAAAVALAVSAVGGVAVVAKKKED